MTSRNDDSETEIEQYGRRITDRNVKIGETLAARAGIDLDAYEDVDAAEFGRRLVAGGPMSDPAAEAYRDVDGRIAKEEILPRIDDDLIAEHGDNPIGQHSDDLERVLTYFRRQPTENKYALAEVEKNQTWRLVRTTGVRGERPERVGDEQFDSQEAAEHALFRRRVRDLRERYGGMSDD
jgi:branched-chain amino acid transport system permease protein